MFPEDTYGAVRVHTNSIKPVDRESSNKSYLNVTVEGGKKFADFIGSPRGEFTVGMRIFGQKIGGVFEFKLGDEPGVEVHPDHRLSDPSLMLKKAIEGFFQDRRRKIGKAA